MLILGIETSCDETAAAVVRDGRHVLSNVISSSREAFQNLAGVIPEEAARQQVEWMIPVLLASLEKAHVGLSDIDAIAVTRGPGLLGSLLVGTTAARTLATVMSKPLIGVHHTLGHLSSTWLLSESSDQADIVFPVLTLSASGGHTELWYRTSHTRGTLLGRTRDDAAGEAFDKGASLLGLPYPGGPAIARAAAEGDSAAFSFPLPLGNGETLDFSFSGLKTSLLYLLRDLGDNRPLPDLAAAYQHALCRHLTDRVVRALETYTDVRELHLVGGVSANAHLRQLTQALLKEKAPHVRLRFPATLAYCTDNAAMIAAAAFFEQQEMLTEPFETMASLPLEQALERP